MQTLAQAIHLAKTEASKNLTIAANALEGLPVGGDPATQQAKRLIDDMLPVRSERSYTTSEFIAAAYREDDAQRYRSAL